MEPWGYRAMGTQNRDDVGTLSGAAPIGSAPKSRIHVAAALGVLQGHSSKMLSLSPAFQGRGAQLPKYS